MTGRADDRAGPNAAGGGAIEAVLLDIDGTLLDSNDAHAQAWSDALREAGREIGSEAVLPLVGMGSDKLLPKLTGIEADSEEGKRLVERRMEIFEKVYLPAIRPFPGARALLERMRQDGLRLVVATSANDRELSGLLGVLGARWLIDEKTSSNDAERSKPDPDIVSAAVRKSGVPASRCVMLGDTPYDVEAARKAGVRMVALRCGGWGDEGLSGATAVYDDPKQVLEQYGATVFASGRRAARDRRLEDRSDAQGA